MSWPQCPTRPKFMNMRISECAHDCILWLLGFIQELYLNHISTTKLWPYKPEFWSYTSLWRLWINALFCWYHVKQGQNYPATMLAWKNKWRDLKVHQVWDSNLTFHIILYWISRVTVGHIVGKQCNAQVLLFTLFYNAGSSHENEKITKYKDIQKNFNRITARVRWF